MMKGLFPLVKVNFQNLILNLMGSGGTRKKRRVSGLVVFLGFAALMLFLSVSFSFGLMVDIGPLGGGGFVLMFTLLLALFMCIVFTLFASQGIIFSAKDVDLVFSLPVSAFTVMLSRVLAVYLEVFSITALIMLPAGVAYMLWGGGSVLTLLLLVLLSAFWALLPTIVALVFGYVISWVASKSRHKNLLMILASFLFIGAIMAGSFALSAGGDTMTTNYAAIEAMMGSAFPPLGWFVQGATAFDLPSILLLIVTTVAPFLLLVWVFSLFYKKIMTSLTSHHLKTNYRLKEVAATGSTAALLKKEWAKFIGTPAYILNCGISIVMLVALTVFAFFQRGAIAAALSDMIAIAPEFSVFVEAMPILLLAAMSFFMLMVYTSAISISLEGPYLWILKEAPLGATKIFGAKIGFNFLICAVLAIVCTPLLGISLGLDLPTVALITLVTLLYGALHSVVGLFNNLLFPRLDAISEASVIKNSGSIYLTMLCDLVAALLVGGLWWLCRVLGLGFVPFALLAILLLAALTAAALALVNTKGRRLFAEL